MGPSAALWQKPGLQCAGVVLSGPGQRDWIISSQTTSPRRRQDVAAGLQELELWLHDLLRGGIAQVQHQPAEYWQGPAGRLVDAQAVSLARQVRNLAQLPGRSADWPERLLLELSEIHLLIQAYKQFDQLEPGLQADIHWAIGWVPSDAALRHQPQVAGRWLVLGSRESKEVGQHLRRSYLLEMATGRLAQITEQKQARTGYETDFPVGQVLPATLVYYPSNAPLRAAVMTAGEPEPAGTFNPAWSQPDLRAALAAFGAILSQNPWQRQYPLILREVTPLQRQNAWYVADQRGEWLAIDPGCPEPWTLLAYSGGRPLTLAAEWNGELLWPLSACVDDRWVELRPLKVR
ncbi:MAG: hypothetical protein KDE09_15985 [Anaerolineales bacterium]|nr:hypothetical protein [Anaerolineales bacterium]